MTSDVVIAGGGIVGCACAYYLAAEGVRCTVVEPGPIGGGATAAGMGHVVAMDDSEAQFALTRYAQVLWDRLYPDLPPSCEPRRCGTLWVAADAEELAHCAEKRAYYEQKGVQTLVIDEIQLREAEPYLRPGLAGGLIVPSDSVIYPMTAATWLLERAIERGSSLIQGERVVKRDTKGALLSSGQRLDCDLLVNAAGAHAPSLTPGLPIEPRKGHLAITERLPHFVRHQLIELGYLKSAHSMDAESVAFNAQPRATGQVLIGSSRQFVGWEPSIDRRLLAKMLHRALEYMPSLASLPIVRTWVGFRAATPDKLPLIGRWDDHTVIAAGHEGLGITTCTATGRLIADLVVGRSSEIDPSPYLARRKVAAHA